MDDLKHKVINLINFTLVRNNSLVRSFEHIRNGYFQHVLMPRVMDKHFESSLFQALESPQNKVQRIEGFDIDTTNVDYLTSWLKSSNCKLESFECDIEDFETLQKMVEFVANGFSTMKIVGLYEVPQRNDVHLYSPPPDHILIINYQGLLDQDQIKWINGVLDGPNCQLEIFASSFFERDYPKQFYFRMKKRLLMMAIASARVGTNSSLKRFPMELQRMLSTFL
jgi:hypothetical protein